MLKNVRMLESGGVVPVLQREHAQAVTRPVRFRLPVLQLPFGLQREHAQAVQLLPKLELKCPLGRAERCCNANMLKR